MNSNIEFDRIVNFFVFLQKKRGYGTFDIFAISDIYQNEIPDAPKVFDDIDLQVYDHYDNITIAPGLTFNNLSLHFSDVNKIPEKTTVINTLDLSQSNVATIEKFGKFGEIYAMYSDLEYIHPSVRADSAYVGNTPFMDNIIAEVLVDLDPYTEESTYILTSYLEREYPFISEWDW